MSNLISIRRADAELSAAERERLKTAIGDFLRWLRRKVHVIGEDDYEVSFPRPTSADWLMRVKRGTPTVVQFNSYMLTTGCSYKFYEFNVLHECFHLFVQDLPNKGDAKRLRDDFGDVLMKALDIEADYFTALYYKERRKSSLLQIFELFYETGTVFGDPNVRFPKLERFIGSILSITNVYLSRPGSRATSECDLFLPTIGNILTEESLHILIARKSHFVLRSLRIEYAEFIALMKCYTNPKSYSMSGYVRELLSFACKVLGYRAIPSKYARQLASVSFRRSRHARKLHAARNTASASKN